MKFLALSAIAGLLLFLMSVKGVASAKDANPQIPAFNFENSFGVCSSDSLDGKFLLVQFWDSKDAKSRINNKEASAYVKNHNHNIRYAGVYSGDDKALYEASVAMDGYDKSSQYFIADKDYSAQMYADFSLSTGNHSFLISPDGKIVAVNPSQEAINSIIAN